MGLLLVFLIRFKIPLNRNIALVVFIFYFYELLIVLFFCRTNSSISQLYVGKMSSSYYDIDKIYPPLSPISFYPEDYSNSVFADLTFDNIDQIIQAPSQPPPDASFDNAMLTLDNIAPQETGSPTSHPSTYQLVDQNFKELFSGNGEASSSKPRSVKRKQNVEIETRF